MYALRFLLSPFSFVYVLIMSARDLAYRSGLFRTVRLPLKIISVGNLTTGGTGKTPFVIYLAELLLRRKLKVAILSRGYRRKGKDIERVVPEVLGAAEKYGDEPLLMALKLPQVPVFVGADRVAAAKKIIDEIKPDVLILDDGFQHRRLGRDLDIVLLDCSVPGWHYRPLPWGWARETFGALFRAHIVVLSKVNFGSEERVRWLEGMIPNVCLRASTEYYLKGFCNRNGDIVRPTSKQVVAVSAIARPETFSKVLKSSGYEVVHEIVRRDHHFWNEADVLEILEKSKELTVVTTAKDYVKLRDLKGLESVDLLTAELDLRVDQRGRELDEFLDRHIS